MSRRKKPLSLQQHLQYGFAVKLTRDFVLSLVVELERAYPRGSLSARKSRAALKALDDLKVVLDDLVCTENPRTENEVVLNAYYGYREWKSPSEIFGLFERLRQELIAQEAEKPPLNEQG